MTVADTRRYVPKDVNAAKFDQLEPLYRELEQRAIASAAELDQWLLDFAELSSVVDEYGSRRYIDKSCYTEDATIKAAFLQFVEEVEPKIKPIYFALQKKFLESPYRAELKGERYEMLSRRWSADVELFRDENVSLETEVTRLVTQYDETAGSMTVQYNGTEYTLQQMARFLEEPDRDVRQQAWEGVADRRLRDRAKIDDLFSQLIRLRTRIARNAGLNCYRTFTWKAFKRFDYTPDDCLAFADAIEKTCVPLVRELDRKRAGELGVDRLRPWDLAVDPKNRPPLRPFAQDEVNVLIDKTKAIFARMSPSLADAFETLRTANNLDLDSRKGKQPGGYQMSLEESKQPFIFMNAAGLQRDVETLLHEGGHAFHFLAAAAEEPLNFIRQAPMEFCEVASMSMEALGADHYDIFYSNPADALRARQTYFEGVLRFFPWMATIDLFQHWIYTHPDHTVDERTAYWLTLMDRFGNDVDWTGYEPARAAQWQRQGHLFHAPFYYVEYGIAQLGALQIWMRSRQDPRAALANYRAALRLGGTRPLPTLFSTAGIQFDFSHRTLGPLMEAISEEL